MGKLRIYLPRVKRERCSACGKKGLGPWKFRDDVFHRGCQYCQAQEVATAAELLEKRKLQLKSST